MKKLLTTAVLAASLAGPPAYAQQARQQGPQDSQALQQQQQLQQQRDMPSSAGSATQMDSATVSELQQSLDSRGFDPGPIDGIWGERTASSLRNYQRTQGLDPTGQPDYNTLSALGIDQSGFGGLNQQDRQMDQRQLRQPQPPLQDSRNRGLDQSPDTAAQPSGSPSISPQSQAPTTGP